MRLPVEKYKDALYRYSTGQGFNVNVEVPEVARQVAAYKMLPLQARNIKPVLQARGIADSRIW